MNGPEPELPIFVKTYDLLAWLAPAANRFPRPHRYGVTQRLLDAGLDLLECLVEANHRRGPARLERLLAADACLDKLRLYLRLAHHWQWLNPGQYEHVSRMVAEVGRLLGGWQKVTRQDAG